MTTTTTSRSDLLLLDPNRPAADFAGLPYTFVTYEGEQLHGVTELGANSPSYEGRMIVRFADNRWAFCDVDYEIGAPGLGEWMDATMREQIASAVPCEECGDLGHTAADHDAEPSPELLAVLAGSVTCGHCDGPHPHNQCRAVDRIRLSEEAAEDDPSTR